MLPLLPVGWNRPVKECAKHPASDWFDAEQEGHAGARELEHEILDSKPELQQTMPDWFFEGVSGQGIWMQYVVVGDSVVSEHSVPNWGQGLLLLLVLQIVVAQDDFRHLLPCPSQKQKWLVVHELLSLCWAQEEFLLDQDPHLHSPSY